MNAENETAALEADIVDYREHNKSSNKRIAELETAIRAAIDDIDNHDECGAYVILKNALSTDETKQTLYYKYVRWFDDNKDPSFKKVLAAMVHLGVNRMREYGASEVEIIRKLRPDPLES